MQEKKTLTFVVPAYNMTEYLERCVISLIAAKRNDDIEVLIVDDGSSDGTLEMAQKFEARYPGIVRAIHQEEQGSRRGRQHRHRGGKRHVREGC